MNDSAVPVTNDLDQLRLAVHRAMLGLLWALAVVVTVVAVLLGNPWIPAGLSGMAVAVVATVAVRRDPGALATRLLVAVALIASVSMLVAAARGSAWQIDLHMCYFAALAMLAAYCDRNVVLAGAAATALHHLALDLLFPAFVFPTLLVPGANQFGRVILHAVVVISEAVVLVWLTQRLASLFASTAANLAAAVASASAARSLEAVAAQQRALADEIRAETDAQKAAATAEQSAVVTALSLGLERLAQGDLTHRLADPFASDYETLRANFNDALAQLALMVRGIVQNIAALRTGADDISLASDNLSRRTEHEAASLEEAAAALEEVTNTVQLSAKGAADAREVVARTKQETDRSAKVVQQAATAMAGIERSSQQIGQILGVIDEIAFQTSLLALNAGVEAARAGDAGRGFAVVASEVRALSQRSASAAKEIKQLIATSQAQVGEGVMLVGETGAALSRIAQQVSEVNTLVVAIAASAKEQASGLVEVNTTITTMDQVTQQNAAMAEQSTAASHALAVRTEELEQLTATFDLGADGATPIQDQPRTPRVAVEDRQREASRPTEAHGRRSRALA